MELVSVSPQLNLYDQTWPILTHQTQAAPAKFVFDEPGRRGEAIESMVSGGCLISGASIRRSLLFTNVEVRAFSQITESVVLPEARIARNCRIHKAIIDRGTIVPEGTEIGVDREADIARGFRITESGVTLVTPDMLGQELHFIR